MTGVAALSYAGFPGTQFLLKWERGQCGLLQDAASDVLYQDESQSRAAGSRGSTPGEHVVTVIRRFSDGLATRCWSFVCPRVCGECGRSGGVEKRKVGAISRHENIHWWENDVSFLFSHHAGLISFAFSALSTTLGERNPKSEPGLMKLVLSRTCV